MKWLAGRKCVCLNSWGLDSAYCMIWAKENFQEVRSIWIDYGQRNIKELESARELADVLSIPFEVYKTDGLLSDSSVLRKEGSSTDFDSLINRWPNLRPISSYVVPWRNLLFFTIAMFKAIQYGFTDIVTGVHEMSWEDSRKINDWCPDDRQIVANATANVFSLALDDDMRVHTPIMTMPRNDVINYFFETTERLEVLKKTRTCWQNTIHSCWECYVCKMRKQGFREAGREDPITYMT